jgi:hypothetical protein
MTKTKVLIDAFKRHEKGGLEPTNPVSLEFDGDFVHIGAGHGKRSVECTALVHALRMAESHLQSRSKSREQDTYKATVRINTTDGVREIVRHPHPL